MVADHIELHWSHVTSDEHPGWEACRGLYAYLFKRQILYLGKMDGCTVHRRWHARDKDPLFAWMRRQRILEIDVDLIVGEFAWSGRLTKQLHADVEGLLIAELQPPGNIASTRSRGITRPGLAVACKGKAWPHSRRRFTDPG
jgi:hypothetical protein